MANSQYYLAPTSWYGLTANQVRALTGFSGGLTTDTMPVKLSDLSSVSKLNELVARAETLTEYKNARITTIGEYAFGYCTSLQTVDLLNVSSIGANAFAYCEALSALILRAGTVVILNSLYALNGTPIKGGTGYIYVPSALVESYKVADQWSNYASQFRAIEDYTVDGTLTGDIDWDKVNAAASTAETTEE